MTEPGPNNSQGPGSPAETEAAGADGAEAHVSAPDMQQVEAEQGLEDDQGTHGAKWEWYCMDGAELTELGTGKRFAK